MWSPVILDKNHLIVLVFALGTFIVGIYLWKMRAVEYEFTGNEIIERRAGRGLVYLTNAQRLGDLTIR
jgi:hypothetical protein